MNKIRCRGKRVGNGEWVYGWYIRASGHWHNKGIHEDWIICYAMQNGGWFALWAKYPVIPETVGRSTGLKDRNGVEIYEGDILHKEFYWGWYVGFEDGAFCRIPTDEVQRINWVHHRMRQSAVEDWEVIGNIHDNPELMRGSEG